MENFIIALVIAAAAIFVVRRVFFGRSCSCGREDCTHKPRKKTPRA
jgi:hypothetical protein